MYKYFKKQPNNKIGKCFGEWKHAYIYKLVGILTKT